METLLVPLISAAIGWGLRHFGVVGPAVTAPQTSPGGGGAVSPPPALPEFGTFLRQLLKEEIKTALIQFKALGGFEPAKPAT